MSTPAISNLTGSPPFSAFGSGLAAGFSLSSLSIRSWKLNRPSLPLTMFALRPLTRILSTMTSPRSSAMSATEACADSSDRNSRSAWRSDRLRPLTFAPRAGKNANSRSPASFRVRPVRSLARRSMSDLYRFGLKVAAKMPAPMTARSSNPPIAQSTIFNGFNGLSRMDVSQSRLEKPLTRPKFDRMQEETVQPPQFNDGAENQGNGKSLEELLAEAQAKIEEQRERMLRAVAETENVRKRLQAEAQAGQKYALEQIGRASCRERV